MIEDINLDGVNDIVSQRKQGKNHKKETKCEEVDNSKVMIIRNDK